MRRTRTRDKHNQAGAVNPPAMFPTPAGRAAPTTPAVPAKAAATSVRTLIASLNATSARSAIIMSEIIGPPLSKRRRQK